MKLVVCILAVSLIGCGKSKGDAEGVVCVASAFPEQVFYPDYQVRKSEVSQCSNGCELYNPVDDDAEGFSSCD